MRRRLIRRSPWLGVLLLFGTLASRADAQQDPECNGIGGGLAPPITQQEVRLCDAAVDGARLFTPVVGVLMGAGNPFVGAPGGLGGFPHLGVTLRANLTRVVLPDLGYDGRGTTVPAGRSLLVPAPLVELALGALPGLRNGAFAVDLLGSAELIPTSVSDKLHADVNADRIGSIVLGFGFGARVTLLPEGRATPAVAASVMRRSLPTIGVGNLLDGDQFAFAANFTAVNYRLTVGKQLGLVVLAAGGGWDHHGGDATIMFTSPLTGQPEPPVPVRLGDGRALAFVDGGAQFGGMYLIAELGALRGKPLGLPTTFVGNDPTATRLFGSVGFRLGL